MEVFTGGEIRIGNTERSQSSEDGIQEPWIGTEGGAAGQDIRIVVYYQGYLGSPGIG